MESRRWCLYATGTPVFAGGNDCEARLDGGEKIRKGRVFAAVRVSLSNVRMQGCRVGFREQAALGIFFGVARDQKAAPRPRPGASFHPPQAHESFNVIGLRKEVEEIHRGNFVAMFT